MEEGYFARLVEFLEGFFFFLCVPAGVALKDLVLLASSMTVSLMIMSVILSLIGIGLVLVRGRHGISSSAQTLCAHPTVRSLAVWVGLATYLELSIGSTTVFSSSLVLALV